jgi:hypothetical protein
VKDIADQSIRSCTKLSPTCGFAASRCTTCVGGVRRPLDGALAQLDVTFVPTEGRLRADTTFMTGAQLDAERRRLVSRVRRRLRV